MRKSMTAYGRAHYLSKLGRWTLDISSVNRKGLDLNIGLPPTLQFLDGDLRKWVQKAAERGQISVRVSFEFLEMEELIRHLQEHKKKWEKVAKALGFPVSSVDFRFLVERHDLGQVPIDEKALKNDLQKAWDVACKNWIGMKEKEGKALVQDIEKRLHHIEKELKIVQKLQPMLQTRYKKKLQERLKEIGRRTSATLPALPRKPPPHQ